MDHRALDNSCNWESIEGFNGTSEVIRFQKWINDQIRDGVAVHIAVESRYSGSTIFQESWFRHTASETIWRLVLPDPPFDGVFELVPQK
jgi:hypothetical protein